MIHAQKKGKPVFVSMGEIAASGGYWIAMNGDHIVAEPGTLTGSIGVVAGKFAVSGLLKNSAMSMDGVRTPDNAGMWTMTEAFTPAAARAGQCAAGQYLSCLRQQRRRARKIPMEKMPDIAKGRVWTGEQAVDIGLVDELGGYREALKSVRKTLKLEDKDMLSLEEFPAQPNPAERLLKLLKHLGAESAGFRPRPRC